MSKFRECPKCGMVMEEQKGIGIEQAAGSSPYALYAEKSSNSVSIYAKKSQKGIGITPFLCPRCGYVELYKTSSRRSSVS